VGDILLIQKGETFPADLIFLSSSALDGICYISTSSLDGEKNLKKRYVARNMDKFMENGSVSEDQLIFVGECKSEQPSIDIYNYAGSLTISGVNISLDVNQLLLKGA